MQTLFDAASIEEIQGRMQHLRLDAPALRGRMTARQMVCHLTDGFRVPLGEERVTVRWAPLRIHPFHWLLVYVLPWPKGKLPPTPKFSARNPRLGMRTKSRGGRHLSGLSNGAARVDRWGHTRPLVSCPPRNGAGSATCTTTTTSSSASEVHREEL